MPALRRTRMIIGSSLRAPCAHRAPRECPRDCWKPGHPRGRGAQLVIGFEFCERVGFYSMVSLLALFLSASRAAGGFGWQDKPALTLLGIFSGLMYALPVVGGWIADRLLGHRRALSVGGTLMFSAYLLLTAIVFMTRVSPVQAPMGLWSLPDGLPAAMSH